jgi:8-amino-7-oxononanoate synthase
MTSLDLFTQKEVEEINKQGLLRKLKIKDNKFLSFADNDYFGLADNELVKQAAKEAIDEFGFGAKASRLVVGNYPLYQKLEQNIAKLKSTESALIFGSGYLTPIGIIPQLVGKGDLVIADKFIHSCLIDGIKLSRADFIRYKHNDLSHLEDLLESKRGQYRRILIVTETIFSMDGDVTDIDQIIAIAQKFNCWLLTDDAHGLQLVKKSNYEFKDHIQIGTLSKSLASYGGYVAGSKRLIDYLVTKSRSLIYSTALPYAVVAAANSAVEILLKDDKLLLKLKSNIQFFEDLIREEGLTDFLCDFGPKGKEDLEDSQNKQGAVPQRSFKNPDPEPVERAKGFSMNKVCQNRPSAGPHPSTGSGSGKTNALTQLAVRSCPIFMFEFRDINLLLSGLEYMEGQGILVGGIRPPTAKTPRFRITISARHDDQSLKFLVKHLSIMFK